MTLLQKTCAFARPRAASLVVSALLKAPVPISNVYCCISNDRVSQSCATTPRPIFPLHARSRNALFLLSRFFCFVFFFPFFAPNHAACVRSGIRIDTDTDIHHPLIHPPLIRSQGGGLSIAVSLRLVLLPPLSLSLSISLSPSFSRCPSNRERYSTVFRISEMAREGWLTIFYCSNRPTNDPCREI